MKKPDFDWDAYEKDIPHKMMRASVTEQEYSLIKSMAIKSNTKVPDYIAGILKAHIRKTNKNGG